MPLVATPGVPFDVAFGVAFTSDYVSRGMTNSNSDPAIQGYIEPSVEIPDVGAAYINVGCPTGCGGGLRNTRDLRSCRRPPTTVDVGKTTH